MADEREAAGAGRMAQGRRRPAGAGSHHAEVVLALLRAAGRPVRLREIMENGIHQQYVAALASEGLIARVARGCYASLRDDGEAREPWECLAAAAIRWPEAVVCGPTAAAFHGLATDEGPLWLAVARGRPRPKGTIGDRELRVREWLAPRIADGIVERLVAGIAVRLVSAERALAEMRELAPRIDAERALRADGIRLTDGSNIAA